MYQNKKSLLVFSLGFLFLMISSRLSYAKGPTYVDPDVCGDKKVVVWNKGGSPYIITGHTRVCEGCTLRILPHVEVKFNEKAIYGETSLKIFGKLEVLGNINKPVVFTANDPNPYPNYWHTIFIEDDATADIKQARFEYGFSGLTARGGDIHLENCTFSHNLESSICLDGSSGSIRNCTITYTDPYGDPYWTHGYTSYGIVVSNRNEEDEKEVEIIGNHIINNNPFELDYKNFEGVYVRGNVKAKIQNNYFYETLSPRAICVDDEWVNDYWLKPQIEIINNTIEGGYFVGIDVNKARSDRVSVVAGNNFIRNVSLSRIIRGGKGINIEYGNVEIIDNFIDGGKHLNPELRSWGIQVNLHPGLMPNLSKVFISGNCIKNNKTGIGNNLNVTPIAVILTNNDISENELGIRNIKRFNESIPFHINYNNIYDNDCNMWTFCIDNFVIDAKFNWWGINYYAGIVAKICSWLGHIDFSSWAENSYDIDCNLQLFD